MTIFAIFGLGALMSLVSSGVVAELYAWPRLRLMTRERALLVLIAPHLFLRFFGLSLLVPGVVSPSLPAAFAQPAAYGDLVAGLLAIVATIALSRRTSWATAAAWLFNVWGTLDLLFANYQGLTIPLRPGDLGAAYFLPTVFVPFLLVTHFLIFRELLARQQATSVTALT